MANISHHSLEKMPLASVDLETTGLKPAQDRICQIGLVDPSDETYRLDLLVDPGIPIPPASTAIHGIDDSMVTGADSFLSPCPNCGGRLATSLIRSYNIGFDLAVLRAEAERHGLEWSAALRALRQAAGDNLPRR